MIRLMLDAKDVMLSWNITNSSKVVNNIIWMSCKGENGETSTWWTEERISRYQLQWVSRGDIMVDDGRQEDQSTIHWLTLEKMIVEDVIASHVGSKK